MSLKDDSFKKLRKEKSKKHIDSWEDYDQVETDFLKQRDQSKEPTITANVRITGGKVKNFQIEIPQNTRPLTDRMKVRIFDILQNDIYKKDILDLYGGSGSFGLEALSRGALTVTFVEAAKRAVKIIENNVAKTGFTSETEIEKMKVEEYLFKNHNEKTFDIIFMDPPYKLYNRKQVHKMEEIVNMASDMLIGVKNKKIKFPGVLLVKHPARYPLETLQLTNCKIAETVDFGWNKISILILK